MVSVDIAAKKMYGVPFSGFFGTDATGFEWWFVFVVVFAASNRDFNQWIFLSDKVGGITSIPNRHEFMDWRLQSGLLEVPFLGPEFTWTNNRFDVDSTFERLDKAYANSSWVQEYPDIAVIHHPNLFSDHAAIILSVSIEDSRVHQPYRIENWCLSTKDIHSIVDSVVSMVVVGSPMLSLSWKLRKEARTTPSESTYSFNIQEEEEMADNRTLRELTAPNLNQQPLCIAYQQLEEGTNVEIKSGLIHLLLAFHGMKGEDPNKHLTEFHVLCFTFTQAFSLALPSSNPLLKSRAKVDNSELVTQLHPFGLCNVLYKCITKCITARLRLVLPSLVFDCQKAFVPGLLLMSDNAQIAYELLSFINASMVRKRFYAALKLNMNKAYDRVRWDFLVHVLKVFSFPPHWIHIIHQCVPTFSYQVLVNGDASPTFLPQCGLWQGNPLSSYLFFLCMEVLSAMLRSAEEQSLIKGICILRGAASISHLFFADDSLLFFQVSPSACDNLMGLLLDFCGMSGQMVNLRKSFIKFIQNTPLDYRVYLACSLRLQCRDSLDSYLGLPKRLFYFASLQLSFAAKLAIINSALVASFNHILSVFQIPSSIC
ncbi:uncharacterized protein LOC110731172 [Chenopodium quinoa]|uniref:uncharacterized protein LOC110731172 n=1 Tax=Chenopodium quinoa TaxID=63459 RepID=UPI000B7783DB|nr:uncharacterized protein LOC110731172 [Chenopodium quinoa]